MAVCAPSRASLFTSRYPDVTRIWDLRSNHRQVGGNFTTIPQFFKEQGYAVSAFGKLFHSGSSSADEQQYSWGAPVSQAVDKYWQKFAGTGRNSWHAVTPEGTVSLTWADYNAQL